MNKQDVDDNTYLHLFFLEWEVLRIRNFHDLLLPESLAKTPKEDKKLQAFEQGGMLAYYDFLQIMKLYADIFDIPYIEINLVEPNEEANIVCQPLSAVQKKRLSKQCEKYIEAILPHLAKEYFIAEQRASKYYKETKEPFMNFINGYAYGYWDIFVKIQMAAETIDEMADDLVDYDDYKEKFGKKVRNILKQTIQKLKRRSHL